MEKKGLLAFLAVVVLLGGAATYLFLQYKEKTRPSTETAELTEYMQVAEDEVLVYENGNLSKERLPYKDGRVYIKLSYVQAKNKCYYWDKGLDKLIFTTEKEILIIDKNSKSYLVEDGIADSESDTDAVVRDAGYVILFDMGDTSYIALDFVKDTLNVSFNFYSNPNRLIIRSKWGDYLFAEVTKDTQLRVGGNIKSAVLRELPAGTKLELTASNGTNSDGFLLATTEDGVTAYVSEKCISEAAYQTLTSDYKAPEYSHILLEDKVNLTWNLCVNRDGNSKLKTLMKDVSGVNVISPTWYNLKDGEGNIDSRASKDYVTMAHAFGCQVWALISNFHPGQGDLGIDEEALLSNRTSRANLINNLIADAEKYGIDGINVDFENLSSATGPHYVQFLRELSIVCRIKGLILSVDNLVPFNYNAYYDIEEQGKVVDYVIIMAYDEHYDGSAAGSVASLTYTQSAISLTSAKVAKEQIVIGLPFYTRAWKETELADGKVKTTSEIVTMADTEAYIKKNKYTESSWLTEEGQHLYTKTNNKDSYKIWVEDADSIKAKCLEVQKAELAGVASWRLGQETSDVWNVIRKYIK